MQEYEKLDTPIEKECYNGIILDEADNYRVVSYSFGQVPSMTQDHATVANFAWSPSVKVYDKIDGTHITMYYYNDSWQIATRCMLANIIDSYSLSLIPALLDEPDAQSMKLGWVPILEDNIEVKVLDHFWKVWSENKYSYPSVPDETHKYALVG